MTFPIAPAPMSAENARKLWLGLAILCLVLAVFHVCMLAFWWHASRTGMPEVYPGQHRGQLIISVGGVALALAIPIPGALTAPYARIRRRTRVLWAAWFVLMAVVVASFIFGVRW